LAAERDEAVTAYEYEVRSGDNVIATGHIQLERPPAPGETLSLGSQQVQVVDVLHLLKSSRLILSA
jgi:hypothetical protein